MIKVLVAAELVQRMIKDDALESAFWAVWSLLTVRKPSIALLSPACRRPSVIAVRCNAVRFTSDAT